MTPPPAAPVPDPMPELQALGQEMARPALLTEAQRIELEGALELAEYSGASGDDVQRLSDAVHAVIPFTTLNIQTAARWLLAQHARLTTPETQA
jgi:hypothetical protein